MLKCGARELWREIVAGASGEHDIRWGNGLDRHSVTDGHLNP
jgi:hypothetical protein